MAVHPCTAGTSDLIRGSLRIYIQDLSGLQCREQVQNVTHQGQRMMQLGALGVKDHNGDVVHRRVLLKAQIAVTGHEDVKLFIRLGEQCAIPESAPAHLLDGYRVMGGERARQPPVEALIDQNAHRLDGFENRQLAGFDDADDLVALHGREGIQKVLDGLPTLQIIDEVLQRHARANKDRRAPHDLRVGMDDAFELFELHALQFSRQAPFQEAGVRRVLAHGVASRGRR